MDVDLIGAAVGSVAAVDHPGFPHAPLLTSAPSRHRQGLFLVPTVHMVSDYVPFNSYRVPTELQGMNESHFGPRERHWVFAIQTRQVWIDRVQF